MTITTPGIQVKVTIRGYSESVIDEATPRLHARSVAVTVDLVIFTVSGDTLQVLLVERGKPPYLGMAALPGGYVREGETLDDTALRELKEETGLDGGRLHLEQLRTFGDPGRDPRGRVVTVAYLALGPNLPDPVAGTDAKFARWAPVDEIDPAELAFDHASILTAALERARSQLEYTTVAAAFCVEPFIISELRRVYEVVWGFPLDPSNFRRKVLGADHFLVPTGERRTPEVGRPAALYRRGTAELLYPPLMRARESSQQKAMSRHR